eukprot:2856129-Rhodomonas_salina.3
MAYRAQSSTRYAMTVPCAGSSRGYVNTSRRTQRVDFAVKGRLPKRGLSSVMSIRFVSTAQRAAGG